MTTLAPHRPASAATTESAGEVCVEVRDQRGGLVCRATPTEAEAAVSTGRARLCAGGRVLRLLGGARRAEITAEDSRTTCRVGLRHEHISRRSDAYCGIRVPIHAATEQDRARAARASLHPALGVWPGAEGGCA